MNNASDLKARLHGQIDSVLKFLLPAGNQKGREYRAGDAHGAAGESLKVVTSGDKIGIWKDFASGEAGDILDLWMLSQNQTFREAFDAAAKFCGYTQVRSPVKKPKPQAPSITELRPVRNTEVAAYLEERGIATETLKLYRVRSFDHTHTRFPFETGRLNHIAFRVWDSEGDLVKIKTCSIGRVGLKQKKEIWSTSPYSTLWGWWLVKTSDRCVIITEGEIDAMTLHQMGPKDPIGNPIPVLSVPNGVQDLDWIENDFDRLAQFEKIYICPDRDQAGEALATSVASRLGLTRVYKLPVPDGIKDVNEAFLTGDEYLSDVSIWMGKAHTFDPPTIQSAREQMQELEDLFRRAAKEKVNTFVFPDIRFQFRDGETTLLTGYPGSGKSALLYQSFYHEMKNGRRVLLCSYEIKPAEMLFGLLRLMYGSKAKERKEEGVAWLGERLWFINPIHPPILDDLWRDIEYAACRYGITRVAIDSLHFLTEKDNYNEQDSISDHFFQLNKRLSLAGVLIAHSSIKKLGADKVPEQAEVEGSGGVTRPPDNGLTVWRNVLKTRAIEAAEENNDQEKLKKAEAMPDAILSIWKQRNTGIHKRYRLWFDSETHSFRTSKDPIEKEDPEQGEMF